MHIHFFLHLYQVPDSSFHNWDPDNQPQRYTDGVGHNILELARRLEIKGHKVSLGPRIDDKPNLVVFFKEHLVYGLKTQVTALLIAMNFPVIHIHSDLPVGQKLSFRPDVEVMPNQTMTIKRNQKYLLSLAQRGLIPSGKSIDSPIELLAIKCNQGNLPRDIRVLQNRINEKFPEIELRIDSYSKEDTKLNLWHDFRGVDISLIIRNPSTWKKEFISKPPNRLINAWLAGTIPIVEPLPAYLEHISHGDDGFVVQNLDEVFQVISKLISDPGLLKRVRESVLKKSEEYKPHVIFETWENLFAKTIDETKLTNLRLWIMVTYFCRYLFYTLIGFVVRKTKTLSKAGTKLSKGIRFV